MEISADYTEYEDRDDMYVSSKAPWVSESSLFAICRNVTTIADATWKLFTFSQGNEGQSYYLNESRVTKKQSDTSICQIAYEYGLSSLHQENARDAAHHLAATLNHEIPRTLHDLHLNSFSGSAIPSIRVSHGDQSTMMTRERFVEGLQALPLNRCLSEDTANQVVDCVIRDLIVRHKGSVSGDELIQLAVYYLGQLDFSIEVGVNHQRLVHRQTSDLIHRGLQDLSASEYAVFARSFKWGL